MHTESVFNMSHDVSGREKLEFICLGCNYENRENKKYQVESAGESCYCVQNGKRVRVPGFTVGSIMSMDCPVGLCPKHKIYEIRNIDGDEIYNEANLNAKSNITDD